MKRSTAPVGERFGKLVVLGDAERYEIEVGSYARWACQCDCGKKTVALAGNIRKGKTKSCGCGIGFGKRTKPQARFIVHGMSKSKIYAVWQTMIARCHRPNSDRYAFYGARGIRVCDRWLKFEDFYADMGDPPFVGACLGRVDNNANYCPENVVWSNRKEEARNRRSSRIVSFCGIKKTLAEWCENFSLSYSGTQVRLKCLDWDMDRLYAQGRMGKGANLEKMEKFKMSVASLYV